MEFIKKNALIVGLIVVVVLGIGGFFVWNQFQSQTLTPKGEEQQNVKQMSPEDIGLELTLRSDGKAVIVKASNTN